MTETTDWKRVYTTEATATGGRAGKVRTADGKLDLNLDLPSDQPTEGTNPEQLFAAGYAACFHSALQGVARRQKVSVEGSEVTCGTSLMKRGSDWALDVEIRVHLPGVDQDLALDLVNAAHATCPYSRAVNGNVDVRLLMQP